MTFSRAFLAIALTVAVLLGWAGAWQLSARPFGRFEAPEGALAQHQNLLAVAPPGARIDAWGHDVLVEGERDGALLLLGAIFFVASLLRIVRPEAQRRIRLAVFLLFLYFLVLPIGAFLLAGNDLELYAYVRGVALFCIGIAVASLLGILIFDVLLGVARLRIPPILREIITGTSFLLVAGWLLSRAGAHITSIVAGSAVLTAVIGLSVQSTIGDLVSGLVLEWEDTVAVGDWIKVGDVTGKVKEIRWRHLSLETRNWETVLLPNSVVVKSNVVVLGERVAEPVQLRRWIYFHVGFEHNPTDVIAAVTEALLQAPIANVAPRPLPNCILYGWTEFAAEYAVRYWLTDLLLDDPTDSVVRTRIYFALQRARIPLALPRREIAMRADDEATRALALKKDLDERLAALRRCKLFSMLKEEEWQALAPHLRHAPFTKGEIMTRQGAEAHWLYLIARGRASVHLDCPNGTSKRINDLVEGDYFGEMALLTGGQREANVVAETDVDCWRLDREGFKDVLERRPEIAAQLAGILATRRVELQEARAGSSKQSLQAAERDLFHEITTFFGLSG